MARLTPTDRQRLLQDLLGYVNPARLAADRKVDRSVQVRLRDRAAGRPTPEDEQYLTSDLTTIMAAHDGLVDWATDLEDLVQRQRATADGQAAERRRLSELYEGVIAQLQAAQVDLGREQALTERLIRRLATVLEDRDAANRALEDRD